VIEHRFSNQDFRQLLDAAPDAVVVVDQRATILYVNRKTVELFGWEDSELLGQLIEVLVPERLRGVHIDDRSRYIATPASRPMGTGRELFARRKDGTEFPVEISLSPLRTTEGLFVSSIIRDITDRKRMEAEQRRTADHLRSAVESIQGAFALFDPDDRLVLCNSTYRELLGHASEGAVLGRTVLELQDLAIANGVYDLAAESAAEFRGRTASQRERPSQPLDVRTHDGRHLRINYARTAEGGSVSTIWDLTDEFERAEEMRRMQELAEAASRAKSEFLSSMSHELRTPLNAVLGFAQLLRRDKKPPLSDRQKGMVDHVLKGGEHLLRLIDEVLDLSRIEAGGVSISTEPVGLQEVLDEVKDALAPLAARNGITIVVTPCPPEAGDVKADRTRLAQILMNYGSNAIKYGRPGGRASFTASAAERGHVRITVVDDGIGIAPDKHERIFQPFQRAGQETGPIEGTGIGLAITKRLAELMGGTVGFTSTADHGSAFWVDLPAHDGAPIRPGTAASARHKSTSLTDRAAPRFTVLYVEDNPANIAFMEELVGDLERVELLTAPTAEIGLELARSRVPDAVIMDINLPGISGFEATRRLHEWPETKRIPVIGLSAAAMPRDKKKAEEIGFYRYLTKPVDVDELTATLEAILVERTED